MHHTQVQPNETAKKDPSGIEPATSRLEDRCSNHYANETRQIKFLTTCYNNFIYVYKYACLVKLKYLQYLVNMDLYTAVLQVKIPAGRDRRVAAAAARLL